MTPAYKGIWSSNSFKSKTQVIAEGNARGLTAADASAFSGRSSSTEMAGAWNAPNGVEIIDSFSNTSSVTVAEIPQSRGSCSKIVLEYD